MQILDLNGHQASLFYIILLYTGKFNYLPDLYDAIGKEETIKLLDIFAGTKIEFPSEEELKKYTAEVDVYLRLKKVSSKRRPSLVRDLAREYVTSEDTIRNTYDRAAKVLERDLGIEVKLGRRPKY